MKKIQANSKERIKVVGRGDMYDKLPKTRRKLARDHFGPK